TWGLLVGMSYGVPQSMSFVTTSLSRPYGTIEFMQVIYGLPESCILNRRSRDAIIKYRPNPALRPV
ncbi:MAG TPA: hypothetical protein VLD57_04245, partial [Blastocatellia bacterium]|nr:hypothetical protein [Blastocatellia bacterium]